MIALGYIALGFQALTLAVLLYFRLRYGPPKGRKP